MVLGFETNGLRCDDLWSDLPLAPRYYVVMNVPDVVG